MHGSNNLFCAWYIALFLEICTYAQCVINQATIRLSSCSQQQLEQLKQKHAETEARAADEAATLQEEIRRRELEEQNLKKEQDEMLRRKQEVTP